ncbi:MAG: hypothetical protein ABJE95_05465 [Byssovorax sp.]
MRRLPLMLLAGSLALVTACSAPAPALPRPSTPTARAAATPPIEDTRPPRWLYTDRIGVIFDPAPPGPALPGAEPALLDGVRVMIANGLLAGSVKSPERLLGFRRLPSRLGGGYALWSDARTYRADTFLGELTVLAELGASGGVRPWIGALLLRTAVGDVLLDPTTRALRRAGIPGLADAVAIDDRHAVRLDALGRATVTDDGGASWTDVLATRGVLVSSLEEQESGVVTLVSSRRPTPRLLLDRQGHLIEPAAPPSAVTSLVSLHAHLLSDLGASPRALPDESLARALLAGTRLPGDRFLVPREGGLTILAGATALPIDDADLASVDEKLARCQPLTAGSGTPLLVCAGELGAEVLSLPGALGHPRLLATFPEQGLFVTGPHDRLGFVGRCGPLPSSSSDLGPPSARPDNGNYAVQGPEWSAPPPLDPSPRVEPSLPEEARYCARISADRWVSRRLSGDDARGLYRFVPGDEGRVTALVLGGDKPSPEGPLPPGPAGVTGDGVRVIRLDPADPALGGAAYPAVRSSPAEIGYRLVDADSWEDDDGAIRGWVRLPAPGETSALPPATAQGPAHRKLRVATARGGRSAGFRLDREGHAQILPLPEGITEVVYGGHFGLAQGVKEGVATTWETVDGGRAWTRVAGPPIGLLAPPPDDAAPHGCSAIGCTWGAGIVRLGWGGPAPEPTSSQDTASAPAASAPLRGPRPVKIACSLGADSAPRAVTAPPKKGRAAIGTAIPISISIPIRLGGSGAIGHLDAGAWTGDAWPPFQPGAALRHLTAVDHSLTTAQGTVIPLLSASPREPTDLLLSIGKRRLRVGAGASSFLPFDIAARIAVAADGPDGELVALDADKGVLWIARGDAVSPAMRLGRVAEVSRVRFTLGRRAPGGGLVVVGYSIATGEVFAGDLDLARAEVGPLVALGAIDTLASGGGCAAPAGTIRFLADLTASLAITGPGSVPVHTQEGLATFLVEASPERLCAAGLEVSVAPGKTADFAVRFGRGGGAALRAPGHVVKGTCALEPAPSNPR